MEKYSKEDLNKNNTEITKEFEEAYFNAFREEVKKLTFLIKKDELDGRISLLKELIQKKNSLEIKYPIVLGGIKCRISVMNMGDIKNASKMYLSENDSINNNIEKLKVFNLNLSEKDIRNNKLSHFYYLNNFLSKRKVTFDDKKLNITCKITLSGPVITCENKKEWKGENFFEKFTSEIDFVEESNWIDFFGLLSPKINQMVSNHLDFS